MEDEELRGFISNTKTAMSIQKLRMTINNRIYSDMVEIYVKLHSSYPKLLLLRRDKNVDRKETAKYVKKLLKESLLNEGKEMENFDEEFKKQKENSVVYKGILELENVAFNNLQSTYKKFAISQWMDEVKGIGLRYGSQLISGIVDITRFSNASKLRTFFGIAPNQRKVRGKEANFNPQLKGLALGKVGTALLMASNSQYKIVYDKAKESLKLMHPEYFNDTKKYPAYPHKWARKKMVQRFMLDLWIAWYRSLGLEPPTKPYSSRYHPTEEYVPIVAWKEEWKLQSEIDAN